jgi:uncharacterized protein
MHIQDASDAPSRASGSGAESPARDQPHGLVQDEFDALAAGYGTADTIYRLGEAQKSISRDLLARIAETGPQHDERFTRAWDLLATLDRTHPAAVEQVLAHPYVRVWAVKVLGSWPATYQDAGGDLAHLGSLVASAVLRAGVAAELSVPVLDAALRLPTFGALALTAAPAEAVIEIRADGSADVRAGDERHRLRLTEDGFGIDADGDPRWQQLRRISADGLEVALEDTDPYRDCHQHAAGRLSAAEAGHWEADFREAIAFTDKFLPNYAPGLRAGLATVMPMARSQDGTKRSAAARHAFGAVGAARPDDPAILALLLVHEFQHVKLGAILDLYELYDTTDTEARHYAPWRPDPRPLEGLLQGTYAHVAVTEFWRVRRTLPDADGSADVQFARWREHTREAVDQLLASGSLTALGERFVRTMGETVARWLDEPVSRDALDRSHRSAREHRAAFERSMAARR